MPTKTHSHSCYQPTLEVTWLKHHDARDTTNTRKRIWMTPKKGYRTCTRCTKNRALRFYTTKGKICATCRKGTTRKLARATHLQQTYGLLLEEYDLILAYQMGKCAICCGLRSGSYDVDHDHRLEKRFIAEGYAPLKARRESIRGLLCKRCNRRLLPAALDRPDILEQAIEYLNNPPAEHILSANL